MWSSVTIYSICALYKLDPKIKYLVCALNKRNRPLDRICEQGNRKKSNEWKKNVCQNGKRGNEQNERRMANINKCSRYANRIRECKHTQNLRSAIWFAFKVAIGISE